jgi:hypothetical protein
MARTGTPCVFEQYGIDPPDTGMGRAGADPLIWLKLENKNERDNRLPRVLLRENNS